MTICDTAGKFRGRAREEAAALMLSLEQQQLLESWAMRGEVCSIRISNGCT